MWEDALTRREVRKLLGARVRELREERGLDRLALGYRSGMSDMEVGGFWGHTRISPSDASHGPCAAVQSRRDDPGEPGHSPMLDGLKSAVRCRIRHN